MTETSKDRKKHKRVLIALSLFGFVWIVGLSKDILSTLGVSESSAGYQWAFVGLAAVFLSLFYWLYSDEFGSSS